MIAPRLLQNFRGNRALVVVAARSMVESLEPTLGKLGLSVDYPALVDGKANLSAYDLQPERDILFVDGDLASPLDPCPASMLPFVPIIGLVGVEAPSRLKALMMLGATAFLRKPVHAGAVYSALFVGINEFLRRRYLEARLEEHERRRHARRSVVKAILRLMQAKGLDDEEAYRQLRRDSMASRQTLEAFCEAFLAQPYGAEENRPDIAGFGQIPLNLKRRKL